LLAGQLINLDCNSRVWLFLHPVEQLLDTDLKHSENSLLIWAVVFPQRARSCSGADGFALAGRCPLCTDRCDDDARRLRSQLTDPLNIFTGDECEDNY
jgi:hypothetical protein